MKKIIYFLMVIALMALVYMPMRALAVAERGTDKYIGGEALVPLFVPVAMAYIEDFRKEEK